MLRSFTWGAHNPDGSVFLANGLARGDARAKQPRVVTKAKRNFSFFSRLCDPPGCGCRVLHHVGKSAAVQTCTINIIVANQLLFLGAVAPGIERFCLILEKLNFLVLSCRKAFPRDRAKSLGRDMRAMLKWKETFSNLWYLIQNNLKRAKIQIKIPDF